MSRHRGWLAPATVLGLLLAGCAAQQPGTAARAPTHPWAWEMPHCVVYQPEAYAAPRHRIDVSITQQERDGLEITVQTERYEAGWGVRAAVEVRAVVRACARYEYGDHGDPAGFREQNLVVDTGFAADESLLVETVRLAPPEPMRTWYTAMVRHGDTIVTVRAAGASAEQIRRFAQQAVASR